MPNSAKRKLAVGAVGIAVLAGSGGAYAAAQSGKASPTPTPTKSKVDRAAEQKAFLDDVAKRLNVTRDQLDAAIKGAAEARIDAAVAAGRITKEQGEAAKKAVANGLPALGGPIPGGGPGRPGFGGPGRPGFGGPGRHGFPGHHFGAIRGAADYLGLSEAQLHEQLRDGKSLADIAKSTQGKTVDGLKAAIKAAIVKDLDEAVKDRRLTDAQRDKIVAALDQRLDDIVNNTPPKGGPGRPKFRWR